MKYAWIVRPYPNGLYRTKDFLLQNIVAIGWPCIGDLTGKNTRDSIKHAVLSYYSYSSPQSLGQSAGNLYRFKEEMKADDYVLVPDGNLVYIGIINSPYKYESSVDSEVEGYPHQRNVKWLHDKKAIPRKFITGRVFDSLKGQQTVFTTYHDDIDDIVKNKRHYFTQQTNIELKNEYLSRLQSGRLININSSTFEDAVCSLFSNYYPGLRRLSTTNSTTGDTDLLAELPPNVTIRIQVKHFYPALGEIQEDVVDQLANSMNIGDNGIIVTSGAVGQDARKKAEQFNDKTIGFIEGQQFVDLLFQSMDNMSQDALNTFGLTTHIGFM